LQLQSAARQMLVGLAGRTPLLAPVSGL